MRLWPALACLLLLAAIGGPPVLPKSQQVLECWKRNTIQDQETCYLCGANLGYVSEQTLYLDAVFQTRPNRWVPAYIGICQGCSTQYGWPLPVPKQEQAVKHWKVVEYEYFGPLYQTVPEVWNRRRKQIDSVRLAKPNE